MLVKNLVKLLVLISLQLNICGKLMAADNLVLVTIDGVRYEEIFSGFDMGLVPYTYHVDPKMQTLLDSIWDEDAVTRREKLMPFFWGELVNKGVLFGDPNSPSTMQVKNVHFNSGPGYNEILTGKDDPSIARQERVYNPNVTVLEWLNNQNIFNKKVVAFCSWDRFKYILNAKRNNMLMNTGFHKLDVPKLTERQQLINRLVDNLPNRMWQDHRYDTLTFYMALDYLKQHQPKVMYISLGDTDDWGHENSYPDYINAIREADSNLAELWHTLQSMPQYKNNTVLIVTTDHGRGATIHDWKDHHKDIPNSKKIWLLAAGKGIKPQGIYQGKGDFYQGQIAATIAKVFGLEQDFRNTDKNIMPSLPIG